MRRLSRVVTSVTSVVSLAVLAGCGGSPPEAGPAPTPSPSADGSAAVTPSVPSVPSTVRSKTRAGAIATTKAFIDSLNYAGATGDTKQLRSLYVDFCARCEAIADGIDETYQNGGVIKGGEWVVTGTKFYSIQRNVAYVDAAVDYTPQVWIRSDGADPESFGETKDVLKAFNLRWTSQARWSVSALDPEAS